MSTCLDSSTSTQVHPTLAVDDPIGAHAPHGGLAADRRCAAAFMVRASRQQLARALQSADATWRGEAVREFHRRQSIRFARECEAQHRADAAASEARRDARFAWADEVRS